MDSLLSLPPLFSYHHPTSPLFPSTTPPPFSQNKKNNKRKNQISSLESQPPRCSPITMAYKNGTGRGVKNTKKTNTRKNKFAYTLVYTHSPAKQSPQLSRPSHLYFPPTLPHTRIHIAISLCTAGDGVLYRVSPPSSMPVSPSPSPLHPFHLGSIRFLRAFDTSRERPGNQATRGRRCVRSGPVTMATKRAPPIGARRQHRFVTSRVSFGPRSPPHRHSSSSMDVPRTHGRI